MLRYFIIQHIDAIITTLGGIFASWIGYSAAKKGDQSHRIKVLKVLGPCIIGFGLLRFLMDSAAPVEWRRVSTADDVASAEFPGAPELNDQTQTLQGQTVRTVGWAYAVPGKDISLRISYGDVPPSELSFTVQDRFNFSKQFFIGQGFKVIQEEATTFGGNPGFHLHMQGAEAKSFAWLRVAYVGTRVYRAVGVVGALFRDDPVIPKFMDSFQIRTATANTSANERVQTSDHDDLISPR